MKATILHDEHGQILGIAGIVDLKAAGSKFTQVGSVPGPGQRTLEIELSGELEKKPLPELHRDYRIDLTTSKLVKRELA
jgi:hypothetical protein